MFGGLFSYVLGLFSYVWGLLFLRLAVSNS